LIFGLLEQNFTSRQLLENLHLYRDIANNARMSWFQFFKWTLLGMTQIDSDLDSFNLIGFASLKVSGILWSSFLDAYCYGNRIRLSIQAVLLWTFGVLER
jgi:hypothetical protein